MRRILDLMVAGLFAAAPVQAGELVLGLGIDDIRLGTHRTAAGMVAVRAEPFAEAYGLQFRLAAAAETDADRDVWVGGGLTLTAPFGDGNWRWIMTTMVGHYRPGDGNDLRQDFPVFRGQIELDRRISEAWRLGVALGHKSNGGTARFNPGVETFYVTLNRRF